MKQQKLSYYKAWLCLFFAIVVLFFAKADPAQGADVALEPPEKVLAWRLTESSIRIRWSRRQEGNGYIIYRRRAGKGKFQKVKEVEGEKRAAWVDKNVKTGKVYEYKVAAKKNKKKSKKSHTVSAIAHKKHGMKINVTHVHFWMTKKTILHNIGDKRDLSPDLSFSGSWKAEEQGAAPVSSKLKYFTSDPEIAVVDSQGIIRIKEKEGTVVVKARAHSGAEDQLTIKVVNYARPQSFLYYGGENRDVNLMLTEYLENVLNIAHYVTVYGEQGKGGTIHLDNSGKIQDYPPLSNIESIYQDVERILREFPLVTDIQVSGRKVNFLMKYNVYGSTYTRISYDAERDISKTSPGRLAPYWDYNDHIAAQDNFFIEEETETQTEMEEQISL